MIKTKHFEKRVNQRGISNDLLAIAEQYGEIYGKDKIRLGKKEIDEIIKEMDRLRKKFLNARDKGGIEIVHEDEVLVTCYKIH